MKDTMVVCELCGKDQFLAMFQTLNLNRWPSCCGQPMGVAFSDADVDEILESLAYQWFIQSIATSNLLPPPGGNDTWRVEWLVGEDVSSANTTL